MTRLVRVRALCDGCSAAAATLFCVTLRNVLCETCDCVSSRSHLPHFTLTNAITAIPFCEYCDDAPATVYCETEGAALCDKCNDTVHKAAPYSHCRTSIQNTLRTRAVQFRSRSQSAAHKISVSQTNQQACMHKSPNANSRMDRKKQRAVSQRAYTSSSFLSNPKLVPKPPREKQANVCDRQNGQFCPPLERSVPISRNSDVSRNHLENTPEDLVLHQAVELQHLEPLHPLQSETDPPRHSLFHTDEYNPFFYSRAPQSNVHVSVDTLPFSSMPSEIAEAAKSLCEPLLITEDSDIQPLETDPLADSDSCSLDLSSVIPTTSLDPASDNTMPHVNLRPPPPSPYTSTLPGSVPHDSTQPTSLPLDTSGDPSMWRNHTGSQSSKTATVAAAATAAAEMFLLKSVPDAAAPKEKQNHASLMDACPEIDPRGVAAAATAAAASAAAAVNMNLGTLSPRPPFPELSLKGRLPRHVSEPALPLRAAAQQHVFDEAMRRLDIDLVKH